MSSIPTLADHLAGRAKPARRAAPSRVHRLDDGEKHPLAARSPFSKPVAPTLPTTITDQEEAMPKGVYPRKPNGQEAPSEPAANGSKPARKRRAKAPRAPRRKDGQPIGAASFVVDDAGGMEIRDGQQVVRLERQDVTRLTLFLDRTKGIRA